MSEPLLAIRNLKVNYGVINAVQGIDLELHRGELVCLIGANGAGKSTTLKALAGLLSPASGELRFCGQDLTRIAAHQRVHAGLALVPEGRGLFPHLSVEENLLMGAFHRRDKTAVRSDLEREYQRFERLAERRQQLAGTLSGGEQQMVALSRALMSRPQLLLLDEPSMGLAPQMVQKILEVVRDVAHAGMTILLVEQNARAALRMASRAYVMEHGAITLSGQASALLTNPAVQAAYLGA